MRLIWVCQASLYTGSTLGPGTIDLPGHNLTLDTSGGEDGQSTSTSPASQLKSIPIESCLAQLVGFDDWLRAVLIGRVVPQFDTDCEAWKSTIFALFGRLNLNLQKVEIFFALLSEELVSFLYLLLLAFIALELFFLDKKAFSKAVAAFPWSV